MGYLANGEPPVPLRVVAATESVASRDTTQPRHNEDHDQRRQPSQEDRRVEGDLSLSSAIPFLLGMAVCVQPGQKAANAAARQRDARIGGAVVKIDGVSIGCHRVAARKHNVLHIAMTLVVRLRRKDPGISSNQALVGLFQIKEGQAKPIDGAGWRPSDAVIEHQPSPRRFDRRRRHANLVGVPPRASSSFQHKLVSAPMPQVRRV